MEELGSSPDHGPAWTRQVSQPKARTQRLGGSDATHPPLARTPRFHAHDSKNHPRTAVRVWNIRLLDIDLARNDVVEEPTSVNPERRDFGPRDEPRQDIVRRETDVLSRCGGTADAEDLKSSEGNPPCGFESHRRHSDSDRQEATRPDGTDSSVDSRGTRNASRTRRQPTAYDGIRPHTATENATELLPAMALDLAEVVNNWPKPDEATRAAVLKCSSAQAGPSGVSGLGIG